MNRIVRAYGIPALFAALVLAVGPANGGPLDDTPPDTSLVPVESPRHSVEVIPEVDFDSTATADELLAAAREMFLADNYPLSEMLYKAVLIRDPDHLSAMLELAIIYEETEKLAYARGLLTRALILKPYDQEIIDRSNEIARKLSMTLEADIDSLIAHEAFAEALPKLSVLLTTQPENADLHFEKAKCHFALDDPAGAVAEIEKALELRKDERYFAFRTRVLSVARDRELADLMREARLLVNSGTPDDRNRVLALLGKILARDPDQAWARRQFLNLTEGGGQPGTPAPAGGEPTRIGRIVSTASERVDALGKGIVGTLNRHLDVLVLALAVLIIFGSPLTYMIVRGFEPHQSLSGRLSQFRIRDVLAMIHAQGRTGVLRVYADSTKGRVYFKAGEICHCVCGGLEGKEALEKVITGAVDGHFVFSRPPRAMPTTIETPLSMILLDLSEKEAKKTSKGPQASPTLPQKKKSKMKTLLESKT